MLAFQLCNFYHQLITLRLVQVVEPPVPRERKKQLSATDKASLLGLRAAGKTWKDIAKILECAESTVLRAYRRVVDSNSLDRKKGTGRTVKTTPRERDMIVRMVRRNRYITSREIKATMPQLNVSRQTIRRVIGQNSEFQCHWQSRKPFISEINRARRVEWARQHLEWTEEDWGKVLWSDESPFVYRFSRRVRVWRTSDEKHSSAVTRATVKHDKKINVWGCFARHGVGRLYLIDGILLKEQYIQIVETQFYPSAMDLFDDMDCIFQEDNDPKHTANIVKAWWRDQQLHRMEWPSQSPDLNPIENLWSILDTHARDRRPNTDQELFDALQEAWNNLDPVLLAQLVDSMPRRCQAVIDSNGYATKY